MHMLYPAAPDKASQVDDTYTAEFEAARRLGLECSVISLEELELGNWQVKPPLSPHSRVLYRGWMLGADAYRQLYDAILAKGALPVTTPEHYLHCHHLPNWYSQCEAWTPETRVFPRNTDFVEALADCNWPAYFIKDYVKSLTTQRGSVAATADEVEEVVTLIERYRGGIEGGVCVRRFEHLLPETEERYFVLDGIAHARDGQVPALAREIAAKVECPFFAMDLVQSQSGELRLIELGDGQVSDLKRWPLERFAQMLAEAARSD